MAVEDSARSQILHYLEGIKKEIIELMLQKKMVASGKTIASLQVIPSHTGGKLVAANNIIFLENGRGPTGNGPFQRDAQGRNLVEIIADWARDKGLTLNPYAVAKRIHKEGTKLYRQGGNSGVLSVPLQAAGLNDLYAEIATMYKKTVSSQIYEPINQLFQTA